MSNNTIISFENVIKFYEDTHVLKNINFEIEKGKFYTLLGPSGCGKTTILRIIAGFTDVSNGKVTLNGADVTNLPPNKRKVNTVFQDYALFPHMNEYENIAFGLRLKKTPENIIKEKVADALKMVQLSGYENREISQMSGGQQQRVLLARALCASDKIILLDEPVTGLDPQAAFDLKQMMREHADKGNTVLLSTHVLEVAEQLCDRIAILKKGELLFYGTIEELKGQHPEKSLESIYLSLAGRREEVSPDAS